jgi:hypothetical protein
MDSVCKVWDSYMAYYAENNPIWTVIFNNGETVYRDDGREGLETNSAWIRLYDYCKENSLYITNMTIGFRDNVYSLRANQDGYYFALGALGMFGYDKTLQLFFVGTLQNGHLSVQSWKVPEMLDRDWDDRDPEKAGVCLIKKPNIMLPSTEH